MMALGDAFTCICLGGTGLFVDSLFLPLMSAAFLSITSASFFGMKFIMDVYTVQAPEREEQQREQRREQERRNGSHGRQDAQVGPRASAGNPGTGGLLPLPVTADRQTGNPSATPVILPPDQDVDADAAEGNQNAGNQTAPTATVTMGSARRELGALYTRFYFLLLAVFLLSLHATTWPNALRSAYANLLSFTYLSLWTPQIYRNIMRNCRKALLWEFVIGQSLLRLAPIAYLYTVENNILWIKTDTTALFVLGGWLWIQVWALASQEILGPRFFVPNGWAPPAYDYHPILREGDGSGESGALLPLGFTDSLNSNNGANPTSPVGNTTVSGTGAPTSAVGSSKKRDGKRVFDCAICTEDIEATVVSTGAGSDSSEGGAASAAGSALSTTLFSRRAYMVTPCRHIFHTTCLEGWMRYRLQCPICRESLPPL